MSDFQLYGMPALFWFGCLWCDIHHQKRFFLTRGIVRKLELTYSFKDTASIKMHAIGPSHVKETSFTALGDKLNIKKLFLVLECLKDCAFASADCLPSFNIMPLARSVVPMATSHGLYRTTSIQSHLPIQGHLVTGPPPNTETTHYTGPPPSTTHSLPL